MHANMCISVSLWFFFFVCVGGCAFSLTIFVVVYLFILTCSCLLVFILSSFLCLPVCFLTRETKTGWIWVGGELGRS